MRAVPTREEMHASLVERHGRDLQARFDAATVAVCGLGGLGSNIAVSLARAGVGRLVLIDFDRVDASNLHRQQYKAAQVGLPKAQALAANLREIAPYIELVPHEERVTPENCAELLRGADVVCEAFDCAEAKAMLAEAVLGGMKDKYLVAASGMVGFAPANAIRTRRISERFYLCGDGVSDVSDCATLVSTRAMLCAAHQAHAALRILAQQYDI